MFEVELKYTYTSRAPYVDNAGLSSMEQVLRYAVPPLPHVA